MSKRWKMKQRGDLAHTDAPPAQVSETPTMIPLGPLAPATLEQVPAGAQKDTIAGLMKSYPNGTMHAADGEFVWRAPAEGFAMMRFFVNADGLIDLRPELGGDRVTKSPPV